MGRKTLPNVAVTVEIITPLGLEANTLAAFIHFLDASPSHSTVVESVFSTETTPRQKATLSSLKTSLSQSLPSYMVPSFILPVAHMPLNGAGKTNRTLLKTLASQHSAQELSSFSISAAEKVQPTTETEFVLRKVWSEVLGLKIDDIGAHDNFFRLGGNSLSAM